MVYSIYITSMVDADLYIPGAIMTWKLSPIEVGEDN